jgi:chaperonin GroEL
LEFRNKKIDGIHHIARCRTALQDAASIAGLLITTEAMVAEVPKKQSPAPAMPGGGMGTMDY